MKRNWRNNLASAAWVLILLTIVMSCNKGHEAHSDTYICPMHPTVVSDRPSTCPVCGMDLVRKARAGEEVEITDQLARLIKSPNESVVASINTVKGEYKSITASAIVHGVVTYDSRNTYTIPARFAGRVEKAYLKYAFQPVRKGERVADIYSPELLSAQRELLFLITNDSTNSGLVNSAKERLGLLGATDRQIEQLLQSRDPKPTFTVFSPYNGYVVSETSVPPTASTTPGATSGGGMNDEMGGSSTQPGTPPQLPATGNDAANLIREGSYVTAGATLYKVVNPAALRVDLSLPASFAHTVRKGSKATLQVDGRTGIEGTVEFIQPFFSEGQEFITARVYTKDVRGLYIGQLVSATIPGTETEALWLPVEAVVDLGIDHVVFVKEKNAFRPKKIVIGVRNNGQVAITQGLSSSDEVAANAQYMVDSESFIKIRADR